MRGEASWVTADSRPGIAGLLEVLAGCPAPATAMTLNSTSGQSSRLCRGAAGSCFDIVQCITRMQPQTRRPPHQHLEDQDKGVHKALEAGQGRVKQR